MKVAELMTTDVATCLATDSLNRAAQLMWERRCGSVPVVDEGWRAVGMLTDLRDVSMAAYTQGRRLDDIAVTLAMSHPVWTCPASATAEEAEGLMMAHGVQRLVVVDADGRLAGLGLTRRHRQTGSRLGRQRRHRSRPRRTGVRRDSP